VSAPAPAPAQAQPIAAILQSAEVQAISFTFGAATILPADFRDLAQKIVEGKITIAMDPVRLSKDGSGAEYNSDTNTLTLKRSVDPTDRYSAGNVVHEAVHAVLDNKGRNLPLLEDEGAAYVTQIWYLANCGEDPARTPEPLRSAVTVLRAQVAGGTSPAALPATDVAAVKVLVASWGYKDIEARKSGI
jgi:hypothetical protein